MKILKSVWALWMRFAHIFGTFQMIVFLSLIYWTMFAVVAIPFRLFADPLQFRRSRSSRWVQRIQTSDPLEFLKRQG